MNLNPTKHLAYGHVMNFMALVLAMAALLGPDTAPAAMVKLVDGSNVSYHPSISGAYSAISNGANASLTGQAGTFRENLEIGRAHV